MKSKPTVLVLGAGASKPYGFPTSEELKANLWRDLIGVRDKAFLDGRREAVINLMRQAGHSDQDIGDFAERLRGTPRTSIDAFLVAQRRFTKVGKTAVKLAIAACENRELLLSPDSKCTDHWYQYLYNCLGKNLEEIDRNKLVILTYNYDRSLETYVQSALRNDFDVDLREAQGIFGTCQSRLPLIHLHGMLGRHAYGDKVVGDPNDDGAIRIVDDEVESMVPHWELAIHHLWQAEHICFLGCAYHEENVRRLPIANKWPPGSPGARRDSSPPPKQVFGTTYGFASQAIQQITRRFSVPTSLEGSGKNADMRISEACRNSGNVKPSCSRQGTGD